ncbi:MAG: T9SS type A sorting domain-containing protein [Haliscomenobacter sp.]|nr:T9SS type A sorting domain-containing protein [Haliscomenobacter sp.]
MMTSLRKRPFPLTSSLFPLGSFFLVLFFGWGMSASAQLSVSFNITHVQCGSAATGAITATASGGTSPYQYAWNTGASTATITKLPPGTYTVTVTDAAQNSIIRSATVNGQPPIVVTFSTNQNCSGPVTVTASASGGTGPYTYNWDGGVSGQVNTFTSSGKYCVTVADSKLCGRIECIQVSVDPLTISLQAQGVTCPEGTNGSVTSTVSGGIGPFTYQWSNGASTANLSGVPGGTYSVTVTDSKGCKANASATVTTPPPFVVGITSVGPTCEGDENGSITITSVTGGTPPYTYRWNSGQTTATRNNLGAGVFAVTITDVLQCTAVRQVELIPRSRLQISTTVKDETCPGENNGMVTVTAINGVAPYTYIWSNGGAGPNAKSNLAPGTYSITVTDAVGCQKTTSVTVDPANPLAITTVKTDATTCGAADGTAEAKITTGTGPFTYAWSNGGSTAKIVNLRQGVYTVTVTDGQGCEKISSVSISEPPSVAVQVLATNVVCEGSTTGSATAAVTGGTMPFIFLWNTGASTQIVQNLGPGTYRVTVTDSKGCEASASATIQQAPKPNVTVTASGIVCGGQNTGTAQAQASGGASPYGYSWNNGATTQNLSGLGSGTYIVTATDANGCTDTAQGVVEIIPALTLSTTAKDADCNDAANGTVNVSVSGGKPPYSYLWNNGATSPQVIGVKAGVYTVTVTDAAGCTASASVTVNEPNAIQINLSGPVLICTGQQKATISSSVSGGTSPYTFAWSNGDTTGNLQNLEPGTYTLTVTDAKGCTAIATRTINGTPPPQIQISAIDTICGIPNGGMAEAIVSSGMSPYSYLWSTGASTAKISGLGSGTYRITVTDVKGCTDTDSVTIVVVPPIQISVMVTPPACYGDSTGSAMASAEGGLPPIAFSWSTGTLGPKLTNVPAGTYTVTATDAAGCRADATVIISQPDSIKLTLSAKDVDCGEAGTGYAVCKATGGKAPYSFLWNTGASTDTLFGLSAGTYTVVVTDANGCETTGTVVIRDFGAPQCNIVVTKPVSSPTASDGEATVLVSGGVAPYDIRWSNGQTGSTATGLSSADYQVTITDANGCRTTCSVRPTVSNALVGDYVWFDTDQDGVQDANELGIPGITVIITTVTENLPPQNDTTVTDKNGLYYFVVEPGSYKITFILPDSLQFTTPNNIANDSLDSDADRVMGMTVVFTVDAGEIDLTWDAGMVNDISLFPSLECECLDNATAKGNGQFKEVLELQGLTGDTWRIIEQTGMYLSSSPAPPAAPLPVPVGTILQEIRSGVYQFGFRHVDAKGYQVKVTNGVDTVSLENVCRYPELEFGLLLETFCFNDEPYTINVPLPMPGKMFYSLNGAPVTSINPKALGPGSYDLVVRFVPDNSLECEAVEIFPFRVVTDNCQVKIGDFVWFDKDENGIQGVSEPGIAGVKAILQQVGTQTVNIDTAITDNTGMYMFLVDPGTYKITFMLPSDTDFVPTKANAGSDDAKDSDMDPVSMMTPVYTISTGVNNLTIDAGFIMPCVNITDPGEIGYDQTLCGIGMDPAPLVSIRDASGGKGVLEYVWMFSTVKDTFEAGSYQMVLNSNSPTYDPGPLTQTTYFARCARRVGCPNFLEPEVVKIVVEGKALADIVAEYTYCKDAPFNLKVDTKTENPQVKWEISPLFGPVEISPNVAFGKVATFVPKSVGWLVAKVTVTENNCTVTDSVRFYVTTSPTYCEGENLVVNALIDNRNQVNLRWHIQDDNLDYAFEVQEGPDGERWKTIAEVDEEMTANAGVRYYQYIDTDVKNGRNFYRVMAQDEFGNQIYSNIVNVAVAMEGQQSLAFVYPNPAESTLYLDILKDVPSNEFVRVEMLQSNGRLMRTWNMAGSQVQDKIDLTGLPNGLYFLRIRIGASSTEVIKVVKE